MKKIYFTLIFLLLAMSGMAYLYFSRLNRENTYNEIGLYAATAHSGLVFCIHNDRSIFEILKGQDLFQHLLGDAKFNKISLLKDKIISSPAINNLIANRNIFIAFSGGKDREINYLISSQLNDEQDKQALVDALQTAGIKASGTRGVMTLPLNDSTTFYLGIEKNLVLLSDKAELVNAGLALNPSQVPHDFVDYIRQNNTLSKNSVGNLFIDFNKIPALLKAILPGNLNGNLALFNRQNSFASLSYNFSRERLFFSGNTKVNAAGSYLNLFTHTASLKNSIDNLLPDNTSNFRLYAIPHYKQWRGTLITWFTSRKEDAKVKQNIADTKQEYRLNAEGIFPVYFKDQLITFETSSSENLGAINLSNGDKVKQLLLDISEDYDQDIKAFKVPELLYSYFGEPLKKFSKPYYVIIDNYMVFANQPGALHNFLNNYRANRLLINTPDYVNLFAQISNSADITFYVNQKNSAPLLRRNIYLPYYKHYLSEKGLGKFSSLIYQLNADKGSFQTNFLINTLPVMQSETPADTILMSK